MSRDPHMVRITRPLFSDFATGKIADIGTFRMGKHGAQFMAITHPVDRKTPKQLALRACFKAARAAWLALPAHDREPWGDFWRSWLITHP